MIDSELRRRVGQFETGYYMDVTFEHDGKQVKDLVEIPYEVFIDGVKKLFETKHVTIGGADNAIWNLLHELDILDSIGESPKFAVICRDIFTSDKYKDKFDAFYAKWVEDWGN